MPIYEQDEYSEEDKKIRMLGKKIKTYPAVWTRTCRWAFVVGGILSILLSSLFIAINAIRLINAISHHGRAILLAQISPILILLFAVFPFGILILILGIHHWHDLTILYDNGFQRQQGKISRTWIWPEVISLDSKFKEVIFAGSPVSHLEEITLKNQDGQAITIKNRNQKCAELVSKIRERVLPLLYQNALNILRIGKRIQFHEGLGVKLGGIEINGKIYPWTKISIVNKKTGTFEIISRTNQQAIYHQRIQNIENFDTLIHLIKNPPTAIRDNTSFAEDVRQDQYVER